MTSCAIITGVSGGIGSALAELYLSNDYLVIGIDKEKVSFDTRDGSFNFIETDLFQFSVEKNYREKILEGIRRCLPAEIGRFVIINNAATQIVKSVVDLEWQDWEESIAVNTTAPFFLAQGMVKELVAVQGHVLNVSSVHAKLTKSNFACYAASKAALEGLTRSMALELSPIGVSVNAVAPGAIATDMLEEGFAEFPEKLKELKACHPSKAIGTTADIAKFIKAITDHEGGFLTGAVLDFNGGISGRLFDPV